MVVPEAVFATLMALSEGDMDRYEIAAASGFVPGYLNQICQGMVANGWIASHGRGGSGCGKWWITERGKIVVAIECGRRTKQRLKGVQPGYTGTRVRDYRYGAV